MMSDYGSNYDDYDRKLQPKHSNIKFINLSISTFGVFWTSSESFLSMPNDLQLNEINSNNNENKTAMCCT